MNNDTPKKPAYTIKGKGTIAGMGNYRVTQPLVTPLPGAWELLRASDEGRTTTGYQTLEEALDYLRRENQHHKETTGGIRIKIGNSLPPLDAPRVRAFCDDNCIEMKTKRELAE